MKKIILMCTAALTIFAADAQVKKSTKKAKRPSKESIAIAKYNQQEADKKSGRQVMLDSLKTTDSLRITNDSLADLQKEADRVAYRQAGLKNIDSVNKETYTALIKQRNATDQNNKAAADLSKEAKLSSYESSRVSYINQQYNEKAKTLLQGSDANQQKPALAALNEERRAKIKAIVGKGKERRLEKDRKEYALKNGGGDSQWVDIAESVSKNN